MHSYDIYYEIKIKNDDSKESSNFLKCSSYVQKRLKSLENKPQGWNAYTVKLFLDNKFELLTDNPIPTWDILDSYLKHFFSHLFIDSNGITDFECTFNIVYTVPAFSAKGTFEGI